MKIVIMILIFNHMIVILLSFLPILLMRIKFAYVESKKIYMLMYHEKNDVCDRYIVDFIHDATENYYDGGTYACTYLNNMKFPLFMLKVLKLHLFCLPMLVDFCYNKLFAYKIPMHRKCVRFKCVCYIISGCSLYASIFFM